MATMVPPIEESKLREKKGREALAQAINMVLLVSILVRLDSYQLIADRLSNDLFLFSFSECHSDDLRDEDYDRPLRVGDRRAKHARQLKKKLLEEEGKRKKLRTSWRPRELSSKGLVLN